MTKKGTYSVLVGLIIVTILFLVSCYGDNKRISVKLSIDSIKTEMYTDERLALSVSPEITDTNEISGQLFYEWTLSGDAALLENSGSDEAVIGGKSAGTAIVKVSAFIVEQDIKEKVGMAEKEISVIPRLSPKSLEPIVAVSFFSDYIQREIEEAGGAEWTPWSASTHKVMEFGDNVSMIDDPFLFLYGVMAEYDTYLSNKDK